jgi:hypothetical protein
VACPSFGEEGETVSDDELDEDAVPVFDQWSAWTQPIGPGGEARHVGFVTDTRVAELRRLSYDEYLETPEWKATRKETLALASHRCNRCGQSRDVMHVHHRTYQNLGREQPEELEVLCPQCHRDEHGI